MRNPPRPYRRPYTYDAESQIKTAAGVTYLYDGDGRRVSKSNGKLYWYGSGGEILAETTATGATLNEYIFFGGKRVAILPAGGNPEYYAEDFLGSSRVMTTNTGTLCYDADFDPYGGEHPYTNTCSQNYKFEGKERDTETGNDDFGARYYTSRFGRWLSSDWSSTPVPVPYANLTNPQTLNLYAMVSDGPESFADLDGHCCSWSASSIADWIDSKVQVFRQDGMSANDHTSPTVAAINTFANGVTGDLASGAANLLRLGDATFSAMQSAGKGDMAGVATGLAQDGGRAGGIILAVVAVAGPKTPATAEQGQSVANEIGRNRVTMDNGSQVDVAGKAHGGVETPHIKDPTFNTNPNTGVTYQNNYGPTRSATVGDVNAAARTAGATPPARIPPPLPVPQQPKENQ
ncbi:MAG: RHS repeat-associated core domain-containing protein [Candidatus Acidiferrum sp.]